jgi:gluconokinase
VFVFFVVIIVIFVGFHNYDEPDAVGRTFILKDFERRGRLQLRGNMLYSAMVNSYPTIIPGLRSPFEQVKGIVYFGRMLDKMRLAASGKLPEGWREARGTNMPNSFDARCSRFLGVDYAALEKETLKGSSTDEALLAWAFKNGRQPSEEEIEIWNAFMTKRGWRDSGTQRLQERLAEIGLPPTAAQTMFEFIDIDEGKRKPDQQ